MFYLREQVICKTICASFAYSPHVLAGNLLAGVCACVRAFARACALSLQRANYFFYLKKQLQNNTYAQFNTYVLLTMFIYILSVN